VTHEPLVEVAGLGKSFPRAGATRRHSEALWAARDVSFTVGVGETVALVGESGAGKSTVGRCLVGLAKPTTGVVRVGGADIAGLRGAAGRAHLAQVGAVFQDSSSSLNPRWTIARSVRHPLDVHRRGTKADRAQLVADLLARVGLSTSHAARFPSQLSGGERQRAAIARALVLKPRLIVCDEPTSALDVSVQAQIVELLMSLHDEEHVACVFISHDLAVVRAVSDRIIVMRAGRVVEEGPADTLLSSPAAEYTRELLAAIPDAPSARADPSPRQGAPS
jgi:ABC-type glutathione transport system ATPase component